MNFSLLVCVQSHFTLDFYLWFLTLFDGEIQALTIDSRIADNAPPRIVRGQRVDDIKQFWAQERKEEL
jgi:hypothetical protein